MSETVGFESRLRAVLARFEDIEIQLQNPSSAEVLKTLSQEHTRLEPLASAARDFLNLQIEREDLERMTRDETEDEEIRQLASEDLPPLQKRIQDLEHQIKILLLPKDEADAKNAILEIRSGTGGEEAALFAANLLRMYKRYAELQGWSFELIQLSETDLGGVKEVCVSISGKNVFSRLKFESGVHRVQRVPQTEAGGRIHTSAATVAVLPEAEDVDIDLREEDLRFDVFRASGPGGQSVNTTDSAVRVTHLPTGLVVQQQDEKSQHKNKAKALKVLRSRLYDLEREKQQQERASSRKNQVGSGDRSERIRTYNFPQGRVTDHRINLTLYKIDAIMEGQLDSLVGPLISEDQAIRLASHDDAIA